MMILGFDAVIAHSTVMTAWWAPNTAGFAVFDGYLKRLTASPLVGFDHRPSGLGWANSQRVLTVFIFERVHVAWEDTRIGHGSSDERTHADEENVGKGDRESWVDVHPEPWGAETEEKAGGHDNEGSGQEVHRCVSSSLPSASQAEYSVSREELIVLPFVCRCFNPHLMWISG
ncbi:hypothetical protein AA313_de0203876 [Arthrobotrys entomopaga]|nr:hypothetical protein AA313_de0203876 [Arthrobotrys entomopaga]